MVYNYTSSKAIIAKTYRDLKAQRNDWINDAVEWIGEALDAINAYPQLVDKASRVKTRSHKAPLPHDLHKIKEVRYGLGNEDKTNKPSAEEFTRVMEYGDSSGHPALVDERSTKSKSAEHNRESFILEPGYIKTSFDSDWVLITYLAFALDDDNFPMVPDDYSHKQALYWYIVLKMVEGGKEHPAGLNYPQVEKRWLKYCNQARNSAKMPDVAKYEQFFQNWVTMVPHLNYRNEPKEYNFKSYEEEEGFESFTFTLSDE